MIYEHRDTLVTSGGSNSTATLRIAHGYGSQLLVRSNTADTVFQVVLTDESGTTRRHYGFHKGELNDTSDAIRFAMAGSYGIKITGAFPNDTFLVVFAVDEGGR